MSTPRLTVRDAARLKREAEEYERAGRPERAAPLYRQILEQKPDSPDILNRLGDLEDRLGRGGEAADAWARSAVLYEQDGLSTRAMSLWKKVLRRSPTHLIARLHLAQLHLQQGLLQEARTQFQTVAHDAPLQSKHPFAIEAIEALIRLDPADLSLRTRLAQSFDDLGEREKAMGTLRAAIDHLSVEGRLSETLPLIHKGLQIDPENAELREALAEIDRLLEAFPPEEPDEVMLVEEVDGETLVPREAGRDDSADADEEPARTVAASGTGTIDGNESAEPAQPSAEEPPPDSRPEPAPPPIEPASASQPASLALSEPTDIEERLARAASEIRSATALLFTSGTGIGVDAGIPDYRDPETFWGTHPAYKERGLRFEDIARPALFERDPAVAWGLFGRRLNAARTATPSEGLAALARWRDAASEGAFVATCSVEGFFEAAGFAPEQIMDCYGRLDHLQCSRRCGQGLFPVDGGSFVVDEETLRAREPYPSCPSCGALARPNVLLFGDLAWDRSRLAEQERRLHDWLDHARKKRGRHFVVVECGEVPPVSTVRSLALKLVADLGAVFVSIKPRGGAAPDDAIVLPLGIRDALLRIDRYLRAR